MGPQQCCAFPAVPRCWTGVTTSPSTPTKMNGATSLQPSRDQTHVRVFFDPIPHLSPLGHTAPDPQMQIYVLTYEKSYGKL